MANVYDTVFDDHASAHGHYVKLSEQSGEPIFSIAGRLRATGAPEDLVESLLAESEKRGEQRQPAPVDAKPQGRKAADDQVTA